MERKSQPFAGDHSPRPRSRAVIAMLLITVIWGWAFIWMKQAIGAGDDWLRALAPESATGAEFAGHGLVCTIGAFMVLRFGAAALALALLSARARAGLDAAAWRGGLLLGGLLVLGFFLQMFGLNFISASESAFLTSLYVLFTAAILAVMARRAPPPQLMVGALLATLGAAYIGGPPQVSFGFGEWLTIAGAFVFALHIVFTDRVTRRVEPMAVTLTSFIVVTIGSLAVASVGFMSSHTPALTDVGVLLGDKRFLIALSCAALFATLIAICAMNIYQRELNPVRAAIIYAIEPVWAAAIAIGIGMEQPSRWLYLGGGALLFGNLVAEWRRAGDNSPSAA